MSPDSDTCAIAIKEFGLEKKYSEVGTKVEEMKGEQNINRGVVLAILPMVIIHQIQ